MVAFWHGGGGAGERDGAGASGECLWVRVGCCWVADRIVESAEEGRGRVFLSCCNPQHWLHLGGCGGWPLATLYCRLVWWYAVGCHGDPAGDRGRGASSSRVTVRWVWLGRRRHHRGRRHHSVCTVAGCPLTDFGACLACQSGARWLT